VRDDDVKRRADRAREHDGARAGRAHGRAGNRTEVDAEMARPVTGRRRVERANNGARDWMHPADVGAGPSGHECSEQHDDDQQNSSHNDLPKTRIISAGKAGGSECTLTRGCDNHDMAQLSLRVETICIDCTDAHAMADFYGPLLGWDVTITEPNFVLMRDPEGGAGLSFQADPRYRAPTWPERADAQDKMIHLDIKVDDLHAAVAHAISCGARVAEYQPQERVRVMLDPAGHPFCLFLD